MQPAPVEEQTPLLKLSLFISFSLPSSLSLSFPVGIIIVASTSSVRTPYPSASLSQETTCSSTSYSTCLGSYLSLSRSYLPVLSTSIFVRTSCIPLLYDSRLNKDCILTRYRCDGGCWWFRLSALTNIDWPTKTTNVLRSIAFKQGFNCTQSFVLLWESVVVQFLQIFNLTLELKRRLTIEELKELAKFSLPWLHFLHCECKK